MFCPLCQAEYREGFTRCSDCDVELVSSLEAEPEAERDDAANPPQLLWSGRDRVLFSRVIAALQDANIPFLERGSATGLHLTPLDYAYEVWTRSRDSEAAERLLASLPLPAQPQEPPIPELALPEVSDEAIDAAPMDLPENWDQEEATVEVWSGEESETVRFLADCLRENGIGCRMPPGKEKQRILVRPEDERHAREIVREICEGAPPA